MKKSYHVKGSLAISLKLCLCHHGCCVGPKGQQSGNRGCQRLLATCARWERLRSSRCTWQPEVPCSARPAGGLAGKHGTTLTQMMRLSHSGSSGCGSGCGSSMVREPRRRAHRDGRASNRARVNDLRARHWSSAARPGARAAHARSLTRQTSRHDRPSPTASVPRRGT